MKATIHAITSIVEITIAENKPFCMFKRIQLGKGVTSIAFNETHQRLCVSHPECVRVFKANYTPLYTINGDAEMASWCPQKLLLLDDDRLVVRAICTMNSRRLNVTEFLQVFENKEGRYTCNQASRLPIWDSALGSLQDTSKRTSHDSIQFDSGTSFDGNASSSTCVGKGTLVRYERYLPDFGIFLEMSQDAHHRQRVLFLSPRAASCLASIRCASPACRLNGFVAQIYDLP